jgi:hypothetical protein
MYFFSCFQILADIILRTHLLPIAYWNMVSVRARVCVTAKNQRSTPKTKTHNRDMDIFPLGQYLLKQGAEKLSPGVGGMGFLLQSHY